MLKELEKGKKPEKTAKTETLLVTPHIAKAWLDVNEINRKPLKRMVDLFARDMASGNWHLTYDPIRFSDDGRLLDGQHRLMACVQSDTPFETFVVYGMATQTRDYIDTGRARSARDVLTLRGINNVAHVATTLRILLSEKDGNSSGSKGFSHAEVLAALERHPQLPMWVPSIRTFPRGISLGTPLPRAHSAALRGGRYSGTPS